MHRNRPEGKQGERPVAKNLSWRQVLFAGMITAMAGFVDGVGFVHLGGYFLSFMSGNSTRSSVALLTGDPAGWAMAMGFVGSFVGGVVAATLVTTAATRYRRALAMYLCGVLLCLAAWGASFGQLGFSGACLLAAAMGAVNVSYTRAGEVSLGLTYMTGTLVKLGQHLAGAILGLLTRRRMGSARLLWVRYAVLWAMITLGSLAGVFAYLHLSLLSLWVPAAGMLLWATLALRSERGGRPLG